LGISLYLHRILRRRYLKGRYKALFFILKMEYNKVLTLVNEALEENVSLFLIEATISPDFKIKVVVDGDNGVTVKDCVKISRHIEHNLDRETEDFSLEVTTGGAAEPLKLKRQYKKNVGRILKVRLIDTTEIEGTLTEVLEDGIVLNWKAREPKPVGKGKITVDKNATIAFENIKEAKAKIIFN